MIFTFKFNSRTNVLEASLFLNNNRILKRTKENGGSLDCRRSFECGLTLNSCKVTMIALMLHAAHDPQTNLARHALGIGNHETVLQSTHCVQ